MSTADKFLIIAENVPKVYNAGYEKGKSEGGGLPDNMEYLNYLQTLTISDIFWEQNSSEEVEIYSPTATSILLGGIDDRNNRVVKHITVTCDTPLTSLGSLINGSSWSFWGLERLTLNVDSSQVTGFANVCKFVQNLKIIDGNPLNFQSRYKAGGNNPFYNCAKIEEFRVVPNTIFYSLNFSTNGMLSDTTLDSVAEGLADLTGTTAETLTFHADVKARIEADDAKEDTDETKHGWLSTITGKNWTIA